MDPNTIKLAMGAAAASAAPVPNPSYNLYTWGINSWGSVGNSESVNQIEPKQIGALTDWSLITTGDNVVHSVKTNGTLWASGNNSN